MSWRAFINGAARVLDLFGTMSPSVDLPETDAEAFRRDHLALMSDFAAIRAAEQDAEITPEIAAALEGERNRAKVKPEALPTRASSHR